MVLIAWTAPKTWVLDELVDESDLNTHVRDNLRALQQMTYVTRAATVAPSASFAEFQFDTEVVDELAAWAVGTPARIFVPYAGRFEVFAHADWTGGTGTGHLKLRIVRYNSGGSLLRVVCQGNAYIVNDSVSCGFAEVFSAGDYITVEHNGSASGTMGTLTGRAVMRAIG